MVGTRRPKTVPPADLGQWLGEYEAAWRRQLLSTKRANRPRAEAAIRALYSLRGLPRPKVAWMPSPLAGLRAYDLALLGYAPVRDPRTSIYPAASRIQDPFHSAGEWRLRDALWEALPQAVASRVVDGDFFAPAHFIRNSLEELISFERALAPDPPSPAVRLSQVRRSAVAQVGRAALGDVWAEDERIVGAAFLEDVVTEAIGRVARAIVRSRDWLRLRTAAMQPGQFDPLWPAYGMLRDLVPNPSARGLRGQERWEQLHWRLQIASSAGPWWALEGLAIACERPLVLQVDARGRLHNESGPAIAYPDGSESWAWHGTWVPAGLLTRRITPDSIARMPNIETRRVMTEVLGIERLVRESGARLRAEDVSGRLWETNWTVDRFRDPRPATFVEVENSTPEPDGTRKHYFIRVPPGMHTAKEAVAWTFEMGEVEYGPQLET